MKKFKKATAVFLSAILASSALMAPMSVFAAEKADRMAKAEQAYEKLGLPTYAEGEVIVVMKNNKSVSSLSSKLAVDDAISIKGESKALNVAVVKDEKRSTKELIEELESDSNVKYVIPNFSKKVSSITNDTYSSYQWALENNGQFGGTAGADVAPEKLWSAVENSDEESVVAVVDTGVDMFNEDIKNVLWVNTYEELPGYGKNGYDFTDTIYDGAPYDDMGHGTHVAGIIAAQADNGIGVSGINKSNVKVLAAKVGDGDGQIYMDAELEAFEYLVEAKELGVNIKSINLSYGGFSTTEGKELYDEIFDIFGELGMVTCIAAGNESLDIDEVYTFDDLWFYAKEDDDDDWDDWDDDWDDYWEDEELYVLPAATESKYAITVAASTQKDGIASFSNYGEKNVDIAAPGVDILSTVSYNCFNPSLYNANKMYALCSFFNKFDGDLPTSGFGSFEAVDYIYDLAEAGFPLGDTISISTNNDGFGTGGKSFDVKITGQPVEEWISWDDEDWDDEDWDDEDWNEENWDDEEYYGAYNEDDDWDDEEDGYYEVIPYYYGFETPFSISDIYAEYDISFMMKGSGIGVVYVFDVPADYQSMDYFEMYPIAFVGGSDDCWNHFVINSGFDYSWGDFGKNTDRKLLFIAQSYDEEMHIQIDDLAISQENPERKNYGKYDFYNGTSMATPYVTGAVALISNADPSLSATDIIKLIKSEGRKSRNFTGLTETSKVLSLDTVADKITPAQSVIYGDVNSDGTVDAKDRIQLSRYLAKWNSVPSINKAASDLNLDGVVDSKDRIILTRHLAKWSGYEKLPKK